MRKSWFDSLYEIIDGLFVPIAVLVAVALAVIAAGGLRIYPSWP